MLRDLDFNPQGTYLEACSYGPDSMALLDMLLKKGVKPIVCHVNYHKREESDQETEDLKKYCKEKDIVFESLDTRFSPESGENFQAWARKIRYDFFKEQYVKYNADGLFVAHQQDDVIETYLLQKLRKTHVKQYGMTKVSILDGMVVLRPLLNFTKKDLLEYCTENNVPYSMDMSNFENKYLRNQIRIDVVSKLSEVERDNVLTEMKNENDDINKFIDNLNEKIEIGQELNIREIIALDEDEFAETLMKFVNQSKVHVSLSLGRIKEIRKICLSRQPNISMPLAPNLYLVKEYDIITLGKDKEELPYSYTMEKPGILDNEHLYLDFTNGATDRNVHNDDYPLTIRSPLPGDEFIISGNLVEVRRLFIDWKMPTRLRELWPIVINKDGKVIYVPRYRKKFVEEKQSKFVLRFIKREDIEDAGNIQ